MRRLIDGGANTAAVVEMVAQHATVAHVVDDALAPLRTQRADVVDAARTLLQERPDLWKTSARASRRAEETARRFVDATERMSSGAEDALRGLDDLRGGADGVALELDRSGIEPIREALVELQRVADHPLEHLMSDHQLRQLRAMQQPGDGVALLRAAQRSMAGPATTDDRARLERMTGWAFFDRHEPHGRWGLRGYDIDAPGAARLRGSDVLASAADRVLDLDAQLTGATDELRAARVAGAGDALAAPEVWTDNAMLTAPSVLRDPEQYRAIASRQVVDWTDRVTSTVDELRAGAARLESPGRWHRRANREAATTELARRYEQVGRALDELDVRRLAWFPGSREGRFHADLLHHDPGPWGAPSPPTSVQLHQRLDAVRDLVRPGGIPAMPTPEHARKVSAGLERLVELLTS